MKKRIAFRPIVFLLSLLALTGCARPAERFFWPPPPNEPRFEWLNVYYSANDFKRSSVSSAMRALAGEDFEFALGKPFDIASDGQGNVYVSDNVKHQVLVFDMNAAQVIPLGAGGTFKEPLGMAVDRQGRLYVADAGQKAVLVFGRDRSPLHSIGNPDSFDKPAFVAVNDALQRIYVTDAKGAKVVVFDMDGRQLFRFGEPGLGDGAFYAPQGVAVAPDGKVFVADMFNFRIQVFDGNGKFLYKFGSQGLDASQFELPKDLAFDSEGHLHVTDARKAAVLSFKPDGTFLLLTGLGKTGHAMGFSLPGGIAIDGKDRMYVVDQLLRRFSEWQYLSAAHLKDHPIDPALIEEQKARMRELQGKVLNQ